MARSKRYRAAEQRRDGARSYALLEAIELVKGSASAKFDETVECHIKLNIRGNQTVRDTTVLPHGFQAQKRILVFARGEKADEARAAGAAHVGAEELVEKIRGGWLDFDVAVATPDMMREVGRLGPVLGRRGLMPNPKTRTVTNDLAAAIAELQRGRVEFRADRTGVVHMAVGKVSMDAHPVSENVSALLDEVGKRRPADLKGVFISSVAVSSTMGPGVKVTPADAAGAAAG
ncbi:MAG: 50S ribosomal protein L1 [Spirochaetaceae bacterium]|nr:50S ribosomal protein L1 [Spirochaetaceae bacterium]MDE0445144.1 50S ribosomal protein L1 [Spirochaetaceae bacterium]